MILATPTIEQQLNQNTAKLLKFLHQVEGSTLTQKNTPEKWSILETYDHLVTMEGLLGPIFNGPTIETDRDPNQIIQSIEKAFYNYDRQYTAMPPIHPQGLVQTKEEVEKQFTQTRQKLIQIGDAKGWAMICKAFPHPAFGELTRWEWVTFCIVHANRHLTIMERMIV